MKNKFEGPKEAAPLDEEAAHDEANMLRAEMGVSPKTGKIEGLRPEEDREPTSEDYDHALKSIEWIKSMIQEHPESTELMAKATKCARALAEVPAIGGGFIWRLEEALKGIDQPGGLKESWRRVGGHLQIGRLDDLAELCDDYEGQLRNLKARGEKFGREEAEKPPEEKAA
jgi:hypothetical protein